MNELRVFENKEMGNVRVIMIKNNPWMVGKDIVEDLGYDLTANTYTKFIEKFIDDEDKIYIDKTQVHIIPEFDYKELGQRGGWLINESGLYSLVLGSELPSAKKFKKWVTSEVLPTIRKTGGYINNSELMVNTYFGSLDDNYKQLVKGLFVNIETQQAKLLEKDKKIQIQSNDIKNKQKVIQGFSDGVTLAEKRQILNKIIKQGGNARTIQGRYKEMYQEFNMKNHMNLSVRYDNYCDTYKEMSRAERKENSVIRITSKIDYIDKILDMIPNLYEVCVKLFKSDMTKLIQQMYDVREVTV